MLADPTGVAGISIIWNQTNVRFSSRSSTYTVIIAFSSDSSGLIAVGRAGASVNMSKRPLPAPPRVV
jgi:hypothetical protein